MNQVLVENKYGHGAIKNKRDFRDRNYTKMARGTAPFDWSKGYDIEVELQTKLNNPNFKIPVKDQGVSDSCVGQASAYYESVQDAFEKGAFTEKSARDAYSQIYYPQTGGSTTRDGLNLLTKPGICKETLMRSSDAGDPPSEAFMRNRSDASTITVADATTAKGTAYGTVDIDIDSFAQALRDNHGMIFTINGQNNGTWLSPFPMPPTKTEWSHELYVGKAKLINGNKFIGVLNSWGANTGQWGWQWIGEDYFANRFIHSTGVLYDSTNDALNAEKSLLERVLALLQVWYLKFTNTDTKQIIN